MDTKQTDPYEKEKQNQIFKKMII
ncbi:hypothetical protein Goklo_007814 [Gossypium klotzschianum]|uniref:Uncharacterized protein n=1 Tax=Gossypium klotzschianum TaxID=34286 RepID=A0A7J8UXU5_9ROSI|nr:hypothetical protein [Gossypium klotzschianum]